MAVAGSASRSARPAPGEGGASSGGEAILGAVIGGRYVLERRIGEGGMAEVFLARDQKANDAPVVIKRCRAHLAYQPEFATLFLREARLASLIHHPNVVELTDTGDDNGLPYLVMEYLRGFNIRDIFLRALKVGGVPQDVAAAIILGAARGLHAAHTALDEKGQPMRLVHRDVSPHNLFVTEEGTIKVLDFGIAKGVNDTTTTRAGHVKGKASYLAPEQLVPDTKVDARTDLFTLGIVAWELFTGKRLFKRATELDTITAIKNLEIENPKRLREDLDDAYAATIQRVLARVPAARPASAEIVAEELSTALARRRGTTDSKGALDVDCAGLLAEFVARIRAIAPASPATDDGAQPAPVLDKVARQRAFEDAWGKSTGTAPAAPPALRAAADALEAARAPKTPPPPPMNSRPATTTVASGKKPAAEENTTTVAAPVAGSWGAGATPTISEGGLRIAGAQAAIDASGGYQTLDAAPGARSERQLATAVSPEAPPPPPPPDPPAPTLRSMNARSRWMTLEPDAPTLAAYLALALVSGAVIAFTLTALLAG